MKTFLVLAFLFFLLGCSEGNCSHDYLPNEWEYSDLRVVDPSDISQATRDVIGFYYRDLGKNIEFRFDLLDLDPDTPTGLILAFNHGYPGTYQLPFGLRSANDWNQLLVLLPDGRIFFLDEKFQHIADTKVSVVRDTTLDAVVIKIDKAALINISPKTSVEIFSIGNDFLSFDELGPILLSGPPPEPIKVMIAFWNTFQSETPAQALRAWDGAHTGPASTRHGLKALLDAVEVSGIPVYLLDLRSHQHFSVLDFMGVLPRIQSLEAKGLIILPKNENIIFPTPYFKELTAEPDNLIFENSLSTVTRKSILETLQMPDRVIVLGGDFSKSAWVNKETIEKLLIYIKNHPWLVTISDKSILKIQVVEESKASDFRISIIQERIKLLPNNQIKKIIQNLISFFLNLGNDEEKELQRQYLGQLGHLLAILEWSKNPKEITDCTSDLDWDYDPECLLATKTTVAVIEPTGGYISFAFTLNSGEFHQIIGPSFQLITGLSDPIEWDLSRGIGADPKVIPGAFVNSNRKWTVYSPVQLSPGSITLINYETETQKTFTALEDGYLFHYVGIDVNHLLFPVILDPWVMEYQGWGDFYKVTSNLSNWRWELNDKIKLDIQSSEPIEIHTFKDSYEFILMPEQPSFAYPEGHFLPFPLALAKIQIDGEVTIRLKVTH